MLAEQKIPSGLAALIIAIEPLVVVVLRAMNSERIGRGTLIGVIAGFIGVAFLLSGGLTGQFELIGIVMVIVGAISWSVRLVLLRPNLAAVRSVRVINRPDARRRRVTHDRGRGGG